MKKFLASLACAALFAVSCAQNPSQTQTAQTAAAGKEGPIKIAFSMPSATHGYMARAIYWAKRGMDDWKKRDPNVEFVFLTADNVTKQANDIEDLIQQGIDGLIVLPFDASVTSVVEKAYRAGIYVVTMDRGLTKPVYDVYVSNDDETYARTASEWMAKALEYSGDIVIIEGASVPINTLRVSTIKATLAQYPKMRVLDSQIGDWNRQKSLAVMENYLQKFKKIDAVITLDDDMMLGALQAYKESGRTDIKYFVGGAGDKNVVKEIMDDSNPLVKANFTYAPSQTATAVSLAVFGVRQKALDGFYQQKMPVRVILSSEVITKENASNYYFPDEP